MYFGFDNYFSRITDVTVPMAVTGPGHQTKPAARAETRALATSWNACSGKVRPVTSGHRRGGWGLATWLRRA